jgi:hypothetical protein
LVPQLRLTRSEDTHTHTHFRTHPHTSTLTHTHTHTHTHMHTHMRTHEQVFAVVAGDRRPLSLAHMLPACGAAVGVARHLFVDLAARRLPVSCLAR